jgi:hypothetical protein
MRKILMGLMAIVLLVGVTTATGYAVFSATATVNNVAFTTGTAGLQFSTDNNSWSSNYTYTNYFESLVYPGYDHFTTVYLYNNSTSNISLGVTAQLVSATGDWDTLSPVMHMVINGVDGTLAQWNSGAFSINLTLTPGAHPGINVEFYVPHAAGNEISGKSVSTNWTFTGTQTP